SGRQIRQAAVSRRGATLRGGALMSSSELERYVYRVQIPEHPSSGDKPTAALARYVYATPPELIRARDFPIDVRTLQLADDPEDDADDEIWLMPTAMILLQWSAARAGQRSIRYSAADVHGMMMAIRLEMTLDSLQD